MVALNPSTSPGSASFIMMVRPLGELMESFTVPLHNTKIPRGICPSTNSTASGGYALAYLMFSRLRRAASGRSQKIRSARSLQVTQLSIISIPYGESIDGLLTQSPPGGGGWLCCQAHAGVTAVT